MDLSQLRQQIDTIDRQIVNLYEERMDVSRQVAEYKIETGKKVFDKQREQEKIAGVKALTHNDFNSHGVEELFEQIMSMSRKLQYQLLAAHGSEGRLPFIGVEELETDCARVVYQGAEGSYSQAAMHRFFGENVNAFHVETFRDAMSAIDEGSADFAVLPIENSTAGIVNEIYDLLVEFENYIVGEQVIPIEHCLLALPGTKMEEIKRVYSHPQSLMQSARYLSEHDWQQISMQNNAFAALKVAKDKDQTQAAIASEYAGQTYGLEILEKAHNGEIDPLTITADQYDLVVNGVELSSGAVRNHDPEIMIRAFELVGLGEKDVKSKFPAMYNAFTYGAPPHAGIAPGVDRIVMLLAGEESIREIIPFPMNKNAQDVMMGAPGKVSEKQLEELHIKLDIEEE